MPLSKKQVVGVFIIVMISPALLWLLFWASILLSSNVYKHNLSESGLWPIICSTRGCITTSGWHKHYKSRQIFAQSTDKQAPNPEDALTTLARQHLVDKAMAYWPVTVRDARRYREEVLQARDAEKVTKTTGMTLEDYDKYVILPLLKQEVLREQMAISDFDELFMKLAERRRIWVLPIGLMWDKETARVVKR